MIIMSGGASQGAVAATPWRHRGTQAAAAETQLPDTDAVNASMSQVGHLAAIFPGTQIPGGGPANLLVPYSVAYEQVTHLRQCLYQFLSPSNLGGHQHLSLVNLVQC